ncbi:MAG: putative tellurite resistance protein B-like protein [Planctomycetota bacterium]|jgi:uncharacterized tellurite resistance protein B-like protein
MLRFTLLILAVGLASPIAEAMQAGGGGSFGGGGGGGGYGGGGDIISWLIYLAFEHPVIGVPTLIVIAFVSLIGMRKGWWGHQQRVIRRVAPQVRNRKSHDVAASLKRNDPGFDEKSFLKRVDRAFRLAQSAWCSQDLEKLRPFVSDGVYERFSLQIDEQMRDGWRQRMTELGSGPLTIAALSSGAHFDTVIVRIPFRATIEREDRVSSELISGSRISRSFFSECWSFVRRRGTKTLTGEGLIEGKCPNCAAPLEMNRSAKCSYCECLARSGQFDWVLTEITQTSEWREDHESQVAGLDDYLQHDPGMNVPMFEDHASVAFWRLQAARRQGEIDPLARVASDELCESYEQKVTVGDDGTRRFSVDSAVGSVRTLGLLKGEAEDHALLQIVWDGVDALWKEGKEERIGATRHLRKSLFLFSRKAGQLTRLDDAFTTVHCTNCGAHDSGGIAASCRYCDAPRRGDRSTWSLHRIEDRSSAEGRKLLANLGDRQLSSAQPTGMGIEQTTSRVELIEWVVAVLKADGVLEERETRALHELAEHLGVPQNQVEALLQSPVESMLRTGVVSDQNARAWIRALADAAMADGQMSKSERNLILKAAARLHVRKGEAELLIRRQRTRHYRASRAATRHEHKIRLSESVQD